MPVAHMTAQINRLRILKMTQEIHRCTFGAGAGRAASAADASNDADFDILLHDNDS
jgi:hypothetical protein